MKPFTYSLIALAALATLLAGCANPALHESEELAHNGQLPQALRVLNAAAEKAPNDHEVAAAQARTREQLVNRLVMQIEGLRLANRWDEAASAVQQLREADSKFPRLAWFDGEIERGRRQEGQLVAAHALVKEGRLDKADAIARAILSESPQSPGAHALISQIAQARPLDAIAATELAPAFQKPVTLEFRDAPLRQVFEALARSSSINFVFDKDVRSDAKVTVFLRNVSLDEAMRVILTTQQLDRKLLNDSTVLIYPNNQAKQREHQELITRTFYLTNADVKTVQAMVRTIGKVRDIHIDERLNLLIVRDTPEVLALVEKLIAAVDLPEPEVVLEVQVMELSTDRVDSLGVQWPSSISYGIPPVTVPTTTINGNTGDAITTSVTSAPAQALLSQHNLFRGWIANPAVVATLTGTSGDVNLLANPKIRVRNHDKAKVQIGEKVPVFTTTSNFSVNTSVAASVSYLDVGLKLEVEPSVQLDNDVVIKVGLEVSNLINQITGPGGSTAFEIGTRQTSTTLRLADGETQILAGLINDEDRRSATGIPGLSRMPVLGRLFGTQTDTRNKSEVVLLITPHVVRNLTLPDSANARLPSGTDASPGAFSAMLKSRSQAGVGLASAGGGGSVAYASPSPAAVPQQPGDAMPAEAVVHMDVTPQVPAGGSVSVTLKNDSPFTIKGDLGYDASKLQTTQTFPGSTPGRLPLEIPPKGDKVVVLRALPTANGQVLNITLDGAQATGLNGESPSVRLDGVGLLTVELPR
ncbi:MAG TPA: secretin N-terminal domain-containing protein [Burkholderiaceae bacterium]|jgi:general secretion pathway protein D